MPGWAPTSSSLRLSKRGRSGRSSPVPSWMSTPHLDWTCRVTDSHGHCHAAGTRRPAVPVGRPGVAPGRSLGRAVYGRLRVSTGLAPRICRLAQAETKKSHLVSRVAPPQRRRGRDGPGLAWGERPGAKIQQGDRILRAPTAPLITRAARSARHERIEPALRGGGIGEVAMADHGGSERSWRWIWKVVSPARGRSPCGEPREFTTSSIVPAKASIRKSHLVHSSIRVLVICHLVQRAPPAPPHPRGEMVPGTSPPRPPPFGVP